MSTTDRGSLRLGVVEEKPREGPFVALPNQTYMVAYTETIPGTNVKFTMLPICGGQFTMGSPMKESHRHADEGPQFRVNVEPFWMGKYEVTWEEYQAFADLNYMFRRLHDQDRFVVTADNQADGVSGPSVPYEPAILYDAGEGPRQPAVVMTQFSAAQYTKFLSLITEHFYRLPTEAEWEYACRAGSKTAFHFGDDPQHLTDYGWFRENTDNRRHDVGGKHPNPWGLYDMHGNVAEWTLDQYSKTGYADVADKAKKMPLTVARAWHHSDMHLPTVARGGGWLMEAHACRSASRLASDDVEWKDQDPDYPPSPWWYTTAPATAVGFRIIRPLKEPRSSAAREVAWAPANKQIFEDAIGKWNDSRRGFYGIVDPSLAKEISVFRKLEE